MEVCRYHGTVTSDALRCWADAKDDHPHSPHAWGAIFRGKEWVADGYVRSRVASNHGRRIVVWRLR